MIPLFWKMSALATVLAPSLTAPSVVWAQESGNKPANIAELIPISEPEKWYGTSDDDLLARLAELVEAQTAPIIQRRDWDSLWPPTIRTVAARVNSKARLCEVLAPLTERLDGVALLADRDRILGQPIPETAGGYIGRVPLTAVIMAEERGAGLLRLRAEACAAAHGADHSTAREAASAVARFTEQVAKPSQLEQSGVGGPAQQYLVRARMESADHLVSQAVQEGRVADAHRIAQRWIAIARSAKAPDSLALALANGIEVLVLKGQPEAARSLLNELRSVADERSEVIRCGVALRLGLSEGRPTSELKLPSFADCADQAEETRSELLYRAGMAVGYALLQSDAGTDRALPAIRAAVDEYRAMSGAAPQDNDFNLVPRELRLFADAAHAARSPANEAALASEAFVSLQEAMLSSAGIAAAVSAGQAGAEANQLGLLATEYQELLRASRPGSLAVPSNATPEQIEAIRRSAEGEGRRVVARRREVEDELRRRFPAYFDLIRPQPATIRTVQAVLGPDEALLLVTPAELGTHSLAVTRDAFRWVRSDWDAERIRQAVTRLRWDLGASVETPEGVDQRWLMQSDNATAFDRGLSHELYRELIGPHAGLLSGRRHVFVVAGDALATLPLSVLSTQKPAGNDSNPADLRATQWFGDTHALSHLPSVQSLILARGSSAHPAKRAATTPLVGIGDPALAGEALVRGGGGRQRAGLRRNSANGFDARSRTVQVRELARLPGTRPELETIRAALKAPASSLILGPDATEARIRASDMGAAQILAFATHGLLPSDLEGLNEAALVLTPPDREDAPAEDDGLLTASEIASMRFAADWVILSACNTGVAQDARGYGDGGLTRAFLYAGASTLLISHWPVRDDLAPLLTTATITMPRERPGVSRAEAMRLAMRRVRDDPVDDAEGSTRAHPRAWAPFTLMGDGAQ